MFSRPVEPNEKNKRWLGEKVPYGGALHVGIRGGFAGGFAGDSQGIRSPCGGIRLKTNALGLRFRGIRSRELKPFIILKRGKWPEHKENTHDLKF